MSLQKLAAETEYPPKRPSTLQTTAYKIISIVDTVSSTPLGLLRRTSYFKYRDEDPELQKLSEWENPLAALTVECHRVLTLVSSKVTEGSLSNDESAARSWADFSSAGFGNSERKILNPVPRVESKPDLKPGDLASITRFDLDDAFWWVWMTSVAGEEHPERRTAFGHCTPIEVRHSFPKTWIVMEEIVHTVASEPRSKAHVAKKRGLWGRLTKS
jgi:hypothetical protein